jgi:NTP pyrophosphatase (non-canonical NTP hydrolase)
MYYPPYHLVFPKQQTMSSYIKDAVRSESVPLNYHPSNQAFRLLHAAMGLGTEAGEFMDALKKHLFYSRPIDAVNLQEEIGDIMWYLAIACDELDVSFEEVQAKNIAKLKARYPDKFTEEKAENRNLVEERAILESRESYNALNQ